MPRESKIPTDPRFGFVTEQAYQFLLEYGYNSFPIDPFRVLEDLSEYVTCLPWSDAKSILNDEDPFHVREQNADARTIYSRKNNHYFIVYDDIGPYSSRRISWTIMHEIGHIILGHLIEFNETSLDRGGLTEKKYGVLEIEANYFAAEALMPTALMRYFSDIEVGEIELLFGVSEEAALKKYKRVFEASYLPNHHLEGKLIRQFYDFIEYNVDDTIYRKIYEPYGIPFKTEFVEMCRKCPECSSYITNKKAKFCPYCGSPIIKRKTAKASWIIFGEIAKFNEKPGVSHFSLYHKEVKNKKGEVIPKTKFCYNCLNHDLPDNAAFCNICGEPLACVCPEEGLILNPEDCFCPSCGKETIRNNHYQKAEKRLARIRDCSSDKAFNPEWIAYPYWGYVCMRIMGVHSKADDDLRTALIYSQAYVSDDDSLIVYTDSPPAALTIQKEADRVLRFINKDENIEYSTLEVILLDDSK